MSVPSSRTSPRVRRVEEARDVEERGLARARGGDQGHDLAGGDGDVDAAQDLHGGGLAGVVGLGDAPERAGRHS